MDDLSELLSIPVLTAIEVVWSVVLVLFLLLERRSPVATLAWILGLLALPGLGLVIYAVFGPRRLANKRRRRSHARAYVKSAAGQAWFLESRRETARGARADDPASELAELAVRAGEAPPSRAERVDVYVRGDHAFRAIEEAIDAATQSIHVEYYIFTNGRLARDLLARLTRRARDGIEVLLLVDALGSAGADDSAFDELRAAGGAVAYFNPLLFAGLRPSLLNFRTHRKIVTVDGRVGFTGGMNVDDAHDERHVGAAAIRDTHVRLEGDVVAALDLVFLEDWGFATDGARPARHPLPPPTGHGTHRVQIVGSGPDEDAGRAIHRQFFAAIAGAQRRVLLTTPYFVPDEPTLLALCTAASRGVEVSILVPAAGDHRFVDAAARAYFPELIAAGARVYLYGPRVLHAKTLVVDDHYAAIGTANFDARSFHLNFEVIAAFLGGEVVSELAARFEGDLGSATRLTEAKVRAEGLLDRLVTGVAKLFAPIL